MRVLRILLAVILICGALAPPFVHADDSDLYSNYLNDAAEGSGNSNFQLYEGNYSLDTVSMSFFKEPLSLVVHLLTKLVFAIHIVLSKLTIVLLSFSLDVNLHSLVEGFIQPFFEALQSSIWSTLAIFAIGISGMILLIRMAVNRTSQALAGLISMMVIVVTALVFFGQPTIILEKVDGITDEIGKSIMAGGYKNHESTVNDNAEVSGVASGLCWDILVHQPWLILNFDSTDIDAETEARILKTSPDSNERDELVKELNEKHGWFSKSIDYQVKRLATTLLLCFFNIILMLTLIVFSFFLLLYRFSVLIFLLMGVIVFFLALFPTYGTQLVKKWMFLIAGAAFSRILIFFFLTVILVFIQVIYAMADEHGLLTSMFLIFALAGAIYMQRHKILGLFVVMAAGHMTSKMRHGADTMMKWDPSISDVGRGAAKMEKSLGEQVKKRFPGKQKEGKEEQEEPPMPANIPSSEDEMAAVVEWDQDEYLKLAREALESSYNTYTSENQDDDQNPFVARTNKVREFGVESFSSQDLSIAFNAAKSHVEGGRDPRMFSLELAEDGSFIKRNLPRPSSLEDAEAGGHMNEGADGAVATAYKGPVGMSYFQKEFGEENGEEMYQRMSSEYGQDLVDQYYSEAENPSYAGVVRDLRQMDFERKQEPPAAFTSDESESPVQEPDEAELPTALAIDEPDMSTQSGDEAEVEAGPPAAPAADGDEPEASAQDAEEVTQLDDEEAAQLEERKAYRLQNAEAKLEEAYLRSKRRAEQAAERENTAPQYSDFVKRTDMVRKSKKDGYHTDDLMTAVKILENMEDRDVPPERVRLEDRKNGWGRTILPEKKTKADETQNKRVTKEEGDGRS